jgi:small conductance mechanosensitive channel
VKDVITGIFILAEDTVAVGDVVDPAATSAVEATLRSIRLRTILSGAHDPFSAACTVMNMTRDMPCSTSASPIADLDRVIDLLCKLGDEMRWDKASPETPASPSRSRASTASPTTP